MEGNVLKHGTGLLLKQKRRKLWYKVVGILACLVVFCTSYALILPAITMERTACCGKEEHQHDESCYAESEILICESEAVSEEHIHTEACYTYEKTLICQMEEHTHAEECYSNESETETAETIAVEQTEETAGETQESESSEMAANHTVSLEASGEDYKVVVTYDESAGIPEGAALKVIEYAEDSGEYQARFAEANAVLLNQEGSYIRRARFFDISIMAGETEIEPANAVKVEISQSADIIENEEDIIITHATNEGTEVISEVEQIQEPNGRVTSSFETKSFSDYGTITPGQSITIKVGDTVTLQGSSGNQNGWTLSPEGYVTKSEDGTNLVVTGAAAGTVTITHQYKNNKSEKFTVIVTDNGGSDAEDEVEKEAAGQDYTVTVKGNKKVLADDVTLHVEDYSSSESDYQNYYDAMITDLESVTSSTISGEGFDFLHMYHIYLTKEGTEGEYIPEGNVNLQVTLTYDSAPEGWPSGNGNLYVGHYKKANGQVSGMEISDGSAASTGVKQIKVSGNSITFHIRSFSVFPVAALALDSGGGTTGGGGTAAPADGSILTSELLKWMGAEGSNEWQIVDGEYNGNAGANKTVSEDEQVRVQKNVIPTDVENEFLVYLSIDTKQLFEDYFASAEYNATSSNNNHDTKLGTVIDSITGNENVHVTGLSTYKNYADFTILSSAGEILAENIRLYWDSSNNYTIYIKVNDGDAVKYVILGTSVKKGNSEVVMLSEEAERLIMSNAAQKAILDEVNDQMGDYIDFLSIVSGDYSTQPVYDQNTRTLTWIPSIKANPTIDKVKTDETKTVSYTDSNGNLQTLTTYKYNSWALNTSELIYRVRLNVSKSGFHSAADNMNSTVGAPESYVVNNSAVLEYAGEGGDQTVDFQQPYVRGLLYDVQFEKVDKEDASKKLSGAAFKLTDDSNNTYTMTELGGTYSIENIPWGTYTLTEETPPKGYSAIKDGDEAGPWTINICYTKDRANVVQDTGNKASNMLYIGKNNAEGVWRIVNKKNIYVDFINTDMSYNILLENGEFSIYDTDPSAEGAEPIEGYEKISVTQGVIADNMELEDGKTYYIVQTKAPDGYILPEENIVALKVDMANTTTSGPISVTGGAGNVKKTEEKQTVNGVDDTTVYVIKIPNNPGVELPSTGGTGTLLYTFGGAGLILISGLMYGYSMRRKRERRLM